MDGTFKVQILKHIAVLEINSKGWHKEFNIVRWNDGNPVYDIRYWDEQHLKMGRGMTFTLDHMKLLKATLNKEPEFDGPTPPIPDKGAEMRAKKAEKERLRAEKKAQKEGKNEKSDA